MRAQDTILRPLQTFTVTDNALVPFEFPTDNDYSRILVEFVGSMVITDNYIAVKAMAPLQLLPTVSLTVNGQKTLVQCDAVSLYCKNGHQNSGSLPAITAPGTAVATHPIAFSFYIDQITVDGINPKDSQLPSSNLASLRLLLQFGATDDCFTVAADGVGTFTGTLTLSAIQVKEYPGKTAEGKTIPRYRPITAQYLSQMRQDFTASNAAFQVRMLTDVMHRLLIINCYDDGVPSDGVLNSIRLERAGDTLARATAAQIRAAMVAVWKGAIPTGLYVVDPARVFGNQLAKLTDGYDMRAPAGGYAEQLYLYIDETTSSGTNTISITQNYFQDYGKFIAA